MGRTIFSRVVPLIAALLVTFVVPARAATPLRRAHPRMLERSAPPPVPLDQIHAFDDRPAPFALDARAALLVDAKTGAVLYSFNEHQKMQPASLAKIMTFFLTLDAIKQGRITEDTKIPISEAAWRLSVDQSLSHMFLQVGQQVAVRDLLYGLMVSSGDDAAEALGEYLGGSSDGFAEQMNAKAKQVGLVETHFVNPSGLPIEGEYTSAADMVKLGRALLEAHPEAIAITSTKDFTFDKIHQPNFNSLLFHDSRVNGIKTGHVEEAGYHLVASADSKGMTLVSAVMGTRSEEKRRVETEKLIDWAFRTFETYQPNLSGVAPTTIPVFGGVEEKVALAPASETSMTLTRGDERKVATSYTSSAKALEAPVAKDQVVGAIAV
ncbi:MAG TPA: D-alanyl-D-alanine carboxypeptidase family protein, partial [Candidatus Binataceae bacterium]|nr:D-alanyl-D-alanine carboxypeptidase family protein [Candidatus Binataceae bacterium]